MPAEKPPVLEAIAQVEACTDYLASFIGTSQPVTDISQISASGYLNRNIAAVYRAHDNEMYFFLNLLSVGAAVPQRGDRLFVLPRAHRVSEKRTVWIPIRGSVFGNFIRLEIWINGDVKAQENWAAGQSIGFAGFVRLENTLGRPTTGFDGSSNEMRRSPQKKRATRRRKKKSDRESTNE